MNAMPEVKEMRKPLSPLLDVEEAAGFCGLKKSTMRSWILHNRITYVKLGRRVFLRRSDLEKLISAGVHLKK